MRKVQRESGAPVLSDPNSIPAIHYRGGNLVPRSARPGGLIVFMPSGGGKSRLQGRGICYTDLMQGIGTVVCDAVGGTIDNCLDKVLYLSQDKQPEVLDRIRYCNMAGEQLESGETLVTSWPMLAKRNSQESYNRVAQRIVDLIARTDRRLANATIQGLKRLAHLLVPVLILLQERQLPISTADDLLRNPKEWEAEVARIGEENPRLKESVSEFLHFCTLSERVREERSEPLRNRLGMLKFDDVQRAMFATQRPPLIDWEEVAAKGLTVFIDLRDETSDQDRELKLFWVWNSLRDYIRSRGSSGHDHPPLSLIIDELSFFVNGTNLNTDVIIEDFRELIQVRKRNANIWLTLATQNQEDLPETLRRACLQIASQLYGSVQDVEIAKELAERWYKADPKKIKDQTRGFKSMPPPPTMLPSRSRGEWEMEGHTLEVKNTTFYTLDEQHYEHSRRFVEQHKGYGLFAQSQFEGHIPRELLPINLNALDLGKNGKPKYVNDQMVTEFRRRLMKRDGVPVSQVLTELDPVTEEAAPSLLTDEGEMPREAAHDGRYQQQPPPPPPSANGQPESGDRFGDLPL